MVSKLNAKMWGLDIPPHQIILELGYVCASILRIESNHLSESTPSPPLRRFDYQAGPSPFSPKTLFGPKDISLAFSSCIVELSLVFLVVLNRVATVLNRFQPRAFHNEPQSASEWLGA